MNARLLSLLPLFLLLFSCSPELPEEVQLAYEELPEALDFNIHVKPILSDKCFACHGPDLAAQKAGLSLHDPEMAFASLKESPGKFAIKPGNLNKSELFHRIISEDTEYRMPSIESNLTLTPREKAILIKQGFNNYNYTLLDSNNKIDEKNAIDGNYYETENIYDAFIYYRANGERYDRVIGKGEASSLNITN